MNRPTIILAGQAHNLTITGGIARWRIATSDVTINLCGNGPIADQCRMMGTGQPIGVIAELPRFTYEWRLDSPAVELTVTRLELLHDPKLMAFCVRNSYRILNSAWDAWGVAADLDRIKATNQNNDGMEWIAEKHRTWPADA